MKATNVTVRPVLEIQVECPKCGLTEQVLEDVDATETELTCDFCNTDIEVTI